MSLHEKLARACRQRGVRRSEIIDFLVARAIERGQSPQEARKGASLATINRWLNGKSIPNANQAADLAAFFGLPLDYLLDPNQDEPLNGPMPAEPGQRDMNKLDLRVNDVDVSIAWPVGARWR